MLTLRDTPSRVLATSIRRLASSLDSYASRKSGTSLTVSSSVFDRPCHTGTSLASRSVSRSGTSRTRPTSRMAALDAIVVKVMICATRSVPYFSDTYRMTFSRPSTEKSQSMSGMDTRSMFRNRSKISPCCSGSRLVIPRQYETRLPAALPRPGPTMIPFFRAKL